MSARRVVIRLISRVRKNWIVGLCIAAFFGGAAALKAFEEYKAVFLPSPGALEVADAKTKEEISKDFLETTWKRSYRSRLFLARIRRGTPEDEIDAAWNSMLDAVEETASKTMVYSLTFSDLYSQNPPKCPSLEELLPPETSLLPQ